VSVVDASVAADALVRREELPAAVQAAMAGRIHVPAIFPAEVTSALRGLLLAGHIGESVAAGARLRLSAVRMRAHPFLPYAERVWALRANLTVYDAWYVAVAERLAQPLVTADAAIIDAPGLECELIDARPGSG
jgi:predicted nucleic acid-binding protein